MGSAENYHSVGERRSREAPAAQPRTQRIGGAIVTLLLIVVPLAILAVLFGLAPLRWIVPS